MQATLRPAAGGAIGRGDDPVSASRTNSRPFPVQAFGKAVAVASRSLWTGSISFGLVNVPVRVFSAVHEHKLQFHLVHEKDDGPIGYEKVCKLEDKPVPSGEIVKAFEYTKGKLVHLTDEDFEAVQVEGQHTSTSRTSCPTTRSTRRSSPTPISSGRRTEPRRPTHCSCARWSESGLAGIGKFVMRNRQYLGCLRVREKALILEQLHFADEVEGAGRRRAVASAGRQRARARLGP